ncbi:helix-turn-helix transcriptional regulator [Zemynaea arenosa]|uniref:helix-turn-helix transcriptional regulator n=1 Tax=Zemynaea arenosa TaxID=2561931 RepID=UPI001431FD92|nr:hypothetical protein [Massilia arenosa]
MARKKNSRLWARLRVLCSSGLDLMCIAPDAFALVRELIPYDAATLYLTGPDGETYTTWQSSVLDCVRNVCASEEFNRKEDRYKISDLVMAAPKVGHMLQPPRSYFASLAYQEIVRPAGQHHVLDVRLELDGRRVGLLMLLRAPGAGFDGDDVDEILRVARYFEHAHRSAGCATLAEACLTEEAMVVANRGGEIMYMSGEAQVMLHELAQQAHAPATPGRVPELCQRVIERLASSQQLDQLPVARMWAPGGIIEARAQWLGGPGGSAGPEDLAERTPVGIFLKRVEPVPLRVWRSLQTAALSPQQTEVAFWMGVGVRRDEVREKVGVSEAGLRDCLKVIYDRFDCSSEAALAATLRGLAA